MKYRKLKIILLLKFQMSSVTKIKKLIYQNQKPGKYIVTMRKNKTISNEYYSNGENNINDNFIQTSSFDEDKNQYKEKKINAYIVDHKRKVENE
jgi:hypothetical protein